MGRGRESLKNSSAGTNAENRTEIRHWGQETAGRRTALAFAPGEVGYH